MRGDYPPLVLEHVIYDGAGLFGHEDLNPPANILEQGRNRTRQLIASRLREAEAALSTLSPTIDDAIALIEGDDPVATWNAILVHGDTDAICFCRV